MSPVSKSVEDRYPWPPPWIEDWCAVVDDEIEVPELIKDLIPSDSIVTISGPAKRSFKTWFAFQLARVIASGKSSGALESVAAAVKVLILEQEGARKPTRGRWEMLAKADGWEIPEGQVLFAHRYPILLSDPTWVKRVSELVIQHDIKFLIIDTLAKSFRGDENNAEAAGDMMRALDSFRNAGTTVCYVHHVRKPSKSGYTDIDDDLRGSSAIPGFYDVHIAFRPDGDSLLMIVRKRDGEEKYFTIWWEFSSDTGTARFFMEEEVELDG